MATDLEAQIFKLEKQIVEKRRQRDAAFLSTWDKVKRVRSHVRGNYGDDSTQYKLIGGTPLSERKPRTRKASPIASEIHEPFPTAVFLSMQALPQKVTVFLPPRSTKAIGSLISDH